MILSVCKKSFIVLFLVAFTASFTSCTMERRLHRPGVHVDFVAAHRKTPKPVTVVDEVCSHEHTAISSRMPKAGLDAYKLVSRRAIEHRSLPANLRVEQAHSQHEVLIQTAKSTLVVDKSVPQEDEPAEKKGLSALSWISLIFFSLSGLSMGFISPFAVFFGGWALYNNRKKRDASFKYHWISYIAFGYCYFASFCWLLLYAFLSAIGILWFILPAVLVLALVAGSIAFILASRKYYEPTQ